MSCGRSLRHSWQVVSLLHMSGCLALLQMLGCLALLLVTGCTQADFLDRCPPGSACDSADGGPSHSDAQVPPLDAGPDHPLNDAGSFMDADAVPPAPDASSLADGPDGPEGVMPDGAVDDAGWPPERGPLRFTSIAADTGHACVTTNRGSVYCWGSVDSDALGRRSAEGCVRGEDGEVLSCPWPGRVEGIDDALQVSVDEAVSCALRATGQVLCWGDNSYGQLGTGSVNSSSAAPFPVRSASGELTNQDALRMGSGFACSRDKSTRKLSCWGANLLRTLGNESLVRDFSAVAVASAASLQMQAFAGGSGHACAATDTGSVACWGYNGYGQTGGIREEGADDWSSARVVERAFSASAQSVAAGDQGSCALLSDGTVVCWGGGNRGLRGSGQLEVPDGPEPTTLDQSALAGGKVTDVSYGLTYGCVRVLLGGTGRVACWGSNVHAATGQPSSNEPTVRPTLLNLEGVQQVSTGLATACAIVDAGEGSQVWCWGNGVGSDPWGEDGSEIPARVLFPAELE